MIYQVYQDQTGIWRDVSESQYSEWTGERRIIEVKYQDQGRAAIPWTEPLTEIVGDYTHDYRIEILGIGHAAVFVPAAHVEAVKSACYQRCPAVWKIGVSAKAY